MKRRLKMKITTLRQQTIRIPASVVRTHCLICEREVETLAAAHAAEVLEVDADTLSQLIDAGQVHAIETVSGSLRVCQDSLFSK